MTTGGLRVEDVSDLLRLPTVVACGGEFLTPKDALAARHFDEIRDRVTESKRRRDEARG